MKFKVKVKKDGLGNYWYFPMRRVLGLFYTQVTYLWALEKGASVECYYKSIEWRNAAIAIFPVLSFSSMSDCYSWIQKTKGNTTKTIAVWSEERLVEEMNKSIAKYMETHSNTTDLT